MAEKRYVIVGSGPAGMSAGMELRAKDNQSKVTIVGGESTPPYSPTVLPYFISGKIKEKDIFPWKEEFLKDQNIELIPGKKVISLSSGEGKIFLEDGSSLHFDILIIATGGRPLIPDISGLKRLNPLVLRTLSDAKRIKTKVKNTSKAIILGAGLIGMQVASALSEMGLSVEVVELMDRVLPGYFDKKASAIIQKIYETHKVRFFTSTEVEEVEKRKGNYVLSIKSGSNLNAPLLLVATGVSPNIESLKGSGVSINKGIIVDKAMRTSIPNIYAAGDVVETDDFWGRGLINQPILINAVDQGRMAAKSAMGEEVSHEGNISMNLFHFFGQNAFSIGIVSEDGEDRFEVYKKYIPSKRIFKKFLFEGDHLVGAMMINTPSDPGVLLQLIRRRIPLGNDKGEFLERPLEVGRKLMCQRWR